MIPFCGQIDAGNPAYLGDGDHDVIQVAVLFEQLEGFVFIYFFAGEVVCRLQESDNFDGV